METREAKTNVDPQEPVFPATLMRVEEMEIEEFKTDATPRELALHVGWMGEEEMEIEENAINVVLQQWTMILPLGRESPPLDEIAGSANT